jgi:hypothetical protein
VESQLFERLVKLCRKELGKDFCLLIDGMDRLPADSKFVDAFVSVARLFHANEIGYCLVCPIATAFGAERVRLAEVFEMFESLPPVHPDSTEDFLTLLLSRRGISDLFDVDSVRLLAAGSGGIVRDMVQLCRESLQVAFAAGSARVAYEHSRAALDALGRSMMIGVLDDEYKALQLATGSRDFTPRTSTDLNLIATKRLIEVREGLRTRYEVHPALLPFIVQEQAS